MHFFGEKKTNYDNTAALKYPKHDIFATKVFMTQVYEILSVSQYSLLTSVIINLILNTILPVL